MWIITPFQKLNINAAPGVGAVALDGLAPSAYISEISPASVGAIVLAGQAPTALVASFTAPGAGAVTLAGLAPTFNIAAAGHRYWRVTDMTVANHDFQCEELQLWETSAVRADDAGTSITSSPAASFGTTARLVDSDFGTYVEFGYPWNDTTSTITWDFGAGVTKAVTGFKHSDRGGGGIGSAFTTIRAQYSDDNSSWTTFGDAAGFAYGSPLSAFVPFVVGVKVPSRAAVTLAGLAPTVTVAGPGHRYWRITDVITGIGNEFSEYELQLWETSSVRADTSSTSVTTTAGLFLGTTDRLVDGDSSSLRVHYYPWSTTEKIVWDFGAGVTKSVSGFKHSDYNSGAAGTSPTTIRLQYSDDNSSWTTFGSATGITSSFATLSSFIAFAPGELALPGVGAVTLAGRAPTVS